MELNIFTSLLALIVIVFLISISFKRFFKRFPPPIPPRLLSPSSLHPIKELLLFLVTNRETQIRLLITFGVLIVYRLLIYIPLPGINHEAFTSVIPLHSPSIISLGIMPFITAYLLIQLLAAVIPHLKRATFGDEKGRYKIVRYTYLLTIVLALVQSYGIGAWLDNFGNASILTMQSVPFRIVATVTLTAGGFLLLFLADIINKYGIGNGIAMLIISAYLLWILEEVYRYWYLLRENMIVIPIAVLIVAIIIGSLYLSFFFTSRERKIVIGGKKSQRKFTIPLRVSWVANAPLMLSSAIIMMPASLMTFSDFPLLRHMAFCIRPDTILYVVVVGILLFFCTYIYASVIFQPTYIQNLLQKYSFSVKKLKGKKLINYLDSGLSRILIITAIMLFVVPLVARLINSLLPSENEGNIRVVVIFLHGDVFVLVFAGVFFDLLSQLEFFYQKNKKPGRKFSVAYVAFDEIEAKIKSEYLKQKNINALVEPLRFTWGIPIRTAIDQYRIYVPEKDVARARKLIE